MIIRKHRTTILIDNDKEPQNDWDFINSKGYKPTQLLRSKIKELRDKEVYGAVDYKKQNTKLHERIDSFCRAMEKHLTKESFKKIMQDIA